ncbi:hypothetical protein MiTe_02505 [Microcystis aeruginosa NIES-2520]|uniref:Pepco domain-containing protein n=1 Tax=Microcystis aeruginosa NIES-2520 TaxID=2303982 RepID=A0A5A5RLF5_MICAE|nr:hypothetical protein [Microcystis aeruginosa]GCA75669.1 hypothetical protein MiTe_02505 [Microcystis aeruginosa NIES-2520]
MRLVAWREKKCNCYGQTTNRRPNSPTSPRRTQPARRAGWHVQDRCDRQCDRCLLGLRRDCAVESEDGGVGEEGGGTGSHNKNEVENSLHWRNQPMSDSTQNSKPTLWMITGSSPIPPSEGEKASGMFRGGRLGGEEETLETEEIGKVPLPVGKLQQNLNQFLVVVGDLFIQADQQAKIAQPESGKDAKPSIHLDQIEFSVAVNGEGEVGFWGLARGKVGGATEIKLTFKRKET